MARPLRVLFVDDNPDDTGLLLREIRKAGYEVTHERVDTAAGLEEALARGRWDVVLADYSMPHFDGLRALALARSRGHDGPFILVSGTIGEDVAVESMKAGADDYVMKGSLTRLVPAIEREVREAENRRQRTAGKRALEISQQRFRALFEVSADGFLLASAEGVVSAANPAAEAILGTPSSTFVGRNIADMLPPEHRERLGTVIRASAGTSGTNEPLEVTLPRRSGPPRLLQIHLRFLADRDEPSSLAIIVHDATAEREAELRKQEAERSAFAAQLAAYVAHELNTPLQNIALLTNAARRFGEHQELTKRLDRIDAQRRRAAEIITDVMRLGRSGPLHLEEADLRSIVEVAVAQVQPHRKPHVRLETHLGDSPVGIRGDVLQLQQVLVNLLSNAFQATETGSVRVAIESSDSKRSVSVSDTGQGMSPETIGRLFQPFFTTKRQGGGTGLGLAFSKRIVEAHGGSIQVVSELGKGSTFTVVLPRHGPEPTNRPATPR